MSTTRESTVEVIHSNFLSKLETLQNAMHVINNSTVKKNINSVTNRKYDDIVCTFNGIRDSYEMEVVDVLTEYYDGDRLTHNTSVSDSYGTHVACENYASRLDQCMKFISSLNDHMKNKPNVVFDADEQLDTLIARFNNIKITIGVTGIEYDKCACGAKMVIYSGTSELVCPECGGSIKLYGTVFEDTQFYSQEGQRSKHGCYDPTRHCKFWIHRIQAKENTDIPKKCIDQVIYCIKRDGIIDGRRLLCSQIRIYLKETYNTEYNDHVPLIRKIITGIVPPQLTAKELRQLYNLFDKAVNAFELIKPPDKTNTMYYPYIIYKIFDQILAGGIRRKKIMECIHLQSRDTLIANDNIWEKICGIVLGIKYRPTNRNDQKIDI
jgi:hypothetical protein